MFASFNTIGESYKDPFFGRQREVVLEDAECYTMTAVDVHVGTFHVLCQAQRLGFSYSTIRTGCERKIQYDSVQLDAHLQRSPWESYCLLLVVAVFDSNLYQVIGVVFIDDFRLNHLVRVPGLR